MNWVDFKRIVKTGLVNFSRKGLVSFAAVLIMTITLAVIGSLVFLQAMLSFSLSEVQERVDINIYFETDAPESQIFALRDVLEQIQEVSAVEYVSQEQALENFQQRHEDDQLTIQALDELEENPLGAALNVKAHNPSDYGGIASFLESDHSLIQETSGIIENINYHQNREIIDRLTNIMNNAERLGFALTLILAFICAIVIFSTIRLTIYISREEISIMRLVGAENRYIRGPFIVEGVLYGIISTIITMALFYPLTLWTSQRTAAFFGMDLFEYYVLNFGQIFLILFLSGIFLGGISSFLAVRRYLKK